MSNGLRSIFPPKFAGARADVATAIRGAAEAFVRQVVEKEARFFPAGEQCRGMTSNLLCWTDIPVTDLDRAITFYSAVLGEAVTKQSPEGFEHGVLPHSGNNPSGCLTMASENKPSRTGPLIYLSVEGRLNEALKTVELSGGKILEAKKQIGPWGYRALILDTEGNRIALHSITA